MKRRQQKRRQQKGIGQLLVGSLIWSMFIGVNATQAQQDAQYTQYMYNTITVNPAYAGSRGVMGVFGLYRKQWIGLDGAPETAVVSLDTPNKNSNLGFGFTVVNDKIGPSDETTFAADVSYTIPASGRFKLSFGLKASANLLNIDFTKLNIYDGMDPSFLNNVDNKFSPNIGAGLYLHSDKTYAGFSVPNFLETRHFDEYASNEASSFVAKEKLHYYFIAGHVFDLSPNIKLKPALLAKAVQGAPLQLDISANTLVNEHFTLGLAYRWNQTVSALAGFQIRPNLFIGYAYDAADKKLANYNSGSHELFLRFELFKRYGNSVSPRFF